jgi:putative transposase
LVCQGQKLRPAAAAAGLFGKAEHWRWSSLAHRLRTEGEELIGELLADWPLPQSADWVRCVNRAETAAELQAVRRSVLRGQPFGSAVWQQRAAKRLHLEYTFRRPGRPKKKPSGQDAG